MKISKTASVKYWFYLKEKIEDDIDNIDLWKDAIELFDERIQHRYLKPVEQIEKDKEFAGEGYAIMTIYCSLIEFLETTFQGINYKFKNPDLNNFEYSNNKSREIFVSFLTNRFGFKISEEIANKFYTNVRCGLLHEAKLNSSWLIRVDGAKLIDEKEGKLIINRMKFSERIKKYLSNYYTKLQADTNLKQAFIRKLDYLCE